MNDCRVCGTPDEKKPMAFRGTGHCSELHRKVLDGELGNDVGKLFEMNLITQDEAARLSSTRVQERPRRTRKIRSAHAEEYYLLERPKPGEK